MKAATILNFSERKLRNSSKEELIRMVLALSAKLSEAQAKSEIQISALEVKLAEKEAALDKKTQADINKTVNQPSSKAAEFNKETGPKKRKKRKKTHKGRKGAGNKPKPEPEITNYNTLDVCPECKTDLTEQPVTETVTHHLYARHYGIPKFLFSPPFVNRGCFKNDDSFG